MNCRFSNFYFKVLTLQATLLCEILAELPVAPCWSTAPTVYHGVYGHSLCPCFLTLKSHMHCRSKIKRKIIVVAFFVVLFGCHSHFKDASYSDPLGEAPVRPKTAVRQANHAAEDEFGDEELGDDLLPD